MCPTPHLDKLNASLTNPKASDDIPILTEAKQHYTEWIEKMNSLESTGRQKLVEKVSLLNKYKNTLDIELIMKQGSDFLRRQKGQLKLDSSIIEEFLIHLMDSKIISGLENQELIIGPQTAFMSLSFQPRGLPEFVKKPEVILKTKDQDFVLGKQIHYKFSTNSDFNREQTFIGSFILPILACECKINFDKTMFQEAVGTAGRLKSGCPVAKYFVLVEYLDMIPEDCRLTEIDNVFLLRHAKRLPVNKRNNISAVEEQHKNYPIDSKVVWRFVKEIQEFVSQAWYDQDHALQKGSFN